LQAMFCQETSMLLIGKWDLNQNIQHVRHDGGVKKYQRGCPRNWRGTNEVHTFVVDDQDILRLLKSMKNWRDYDQDGCVMRGMHHTQFVPRDGEEELDQLFHSYSSDKVTITFRLICTPPGVYSTLGHLQESVGMWRLPDFTKCICKKFLEEQSYWGRHHFEVLGLAWIIADSSILSSQRLE
jgi:hypothetical protein